MFEQMKWENLYELWKMGSYQFPNLLTSPISVETVFIEYKQDGFIYGYDWLENAAADKRKQLIKKSPAEFLYFSKPTNKGTIQTAEMLAEAQSQEELAAIWIAATAKELSEYRFGNGLGHYADTLYWTACDFLSARYALWHHAMKKLVPEIMVPMAVLENIACKDAAPVVGLIQTNTLLLENTWSILKYTSLEGEECPNVSCRLRHE